MEEVKNTDQKIMFRLNETSELNRQNREDFFSFERKSECQTITVLAPMPVTVFRW
jgi:hypothetical protein